MYLYSHRLLSLSDLIEKSLCSEPISECRSSQVVRMPRVSVCGALSHKRDAYSISLQPASAVWLRDDHEGEAKRSDQSKTVSSGYDAAPTISQKRWLTARDLSTTKASTFQHGEGKGSQAEQLLLNEELIDS